MNCAAFRPAVMKRVDSGSNSAARRNKLLFSDPHKSLVRTDQDDCTFPDRTHCEQRVAEIVHARGRFPLDAVQQVHERASCKGGVLGFAHLRRCHHLHRFGDLSGAAHRLDPSS